MAKDLEEGRPCPVCGSLHHPEKAVVSDEAPTKEQLDESKTGMETLEKLAAKASEEAGVLSARAEEKRADIGKSAKEFFADTEDIDKIETALSLKLAEEKKKREGIAASLEETEKKIARKEELGKIIPDAEKEMKELTDSVAYDEGEQKNLSALSAELSSQKEGLSKDLEYSSKSEAEAAVETKKKEKEELQNALNFAKEEFEKGEKEFVRLTSSIAEAKSALENKPEVDVEKETAREEELKAKKASLSDKILEVRTRLSADRAVLKNVEKALLKLSEKERELRWTSSLSDTANGNLSGKEKIMLETYVQMAYFDRIINRANTRLMIMSGGQYELKRRVEAENLRSKMGLDLNVIDHYNGSERVADTLSGGETFLASLALALGLSDEIQSSAGGIRLDTMFVDEGFGSLSQDALEQAMRALAGLSGGERLVGIISHVSELKERIDRQIVVTKDPLGGSKAKIIV